MDKPLPTVAILGASGLIGQAVASSLLRDGFPVLALARKFTPDQKATFADKAVECSIVDLNSDALARLLLERKVEIAVNCIGVLQDAGRGRTEDVHCGFAVRLVEAVKAQATPTLLVHISIPGRKNEDCTPFSRSKREAEHIIATSMIPHVILRPGFVIAPAAYGGSALIRALAASPVALPARVADRPFASTEIGDIARTIAIAAKRWRAGEIEWAIVWDVMERHPTTVGGVIEAFQRRFGGPKKRLRLPAWLMDFGAKAGDLSACLGWAPPVRTTAVQEMRRGVEGNPEPWIEATGIQPRPLSETLRHLQPTVQEKWFARLYLTKALIIGALSLFWTVSGLIALTVAFDAATAILTSHGLPLPLSQAITLGSSVTNIGIGVAIAVRKTCRIGLLAGLAVSALYVFGATLIAPDLWIEPLGALVKTGPAMILMLVALAILEDR